MKYIGCTIYYGNASSYKTFPFFSNRVPTTIKERSDRILRWLIAPSKIVIVIPIDIFPNLPEDVKCRIPSTYPVLAVMYTERHLKYIPEHKATLREL